MKFHYQFYDKLSSCQSGIRAPNTQSLRMESRLECWIKTTDGDDKDCDRPTGGSKANLRGGTEEKDSKRDGRNLDI